MRSEASVRMMAGRLLVAALGMGFLFGIGSCIFNEEGETLAPSPQGCSKDTDCPGEQICVGNLCSGLGAPCSNDYDCPGEEICENNVCVLVDPDVPPTDQKNLGQKLCAEAGICKESITETDWGSFYSPVDLTKVTEDSKGRLISSNTVLVKLNSTDPSIVKVLFSSLGIKVAGYWSSTGHFVLELDSSQHANIGQLSDALNADPLVAIVHPNPVASLDSMDMTDLGGGHGSAFNNIGLEEAFQLLETEGIITSNVLTAVMDSSFAAHPDLDYFVGVDLADVDNDFGNSDISPSCQGWYHGTAVAGLLAGRNGNGGINGVCPDCKLMPLKILPSEPCEADANTLLSVVGIALEAAAESDIDVINMSFGIYYDEEEIVALHEMIKKCHDKEIVLVASAGNGHPLGSGIDASSHFPSAYPEVISVGAVTLEDKRPMFSNYSQDNDPDVLTIFAPGTLVTTSFPGPSGEGCEDCGGSPCTVLEGTSVSAPIVSGVVGLLLSIDKSLTPLQIRSVILDTAKNTSAGKRIDVYEAVKFVLSRECQPSCGGKECGNDGCGGSCGGCQQGYSCKNGQCKEGPCQADCSGKDCGDDGCDGSCGPCYGQDECQGGQCICQPNCSGKECGDDGCGGSCGACGGNEICQDGKCMGEEQPGCQGGCGDCGKCSTDPPQIGSYCKADISKNGKMCEGNPSKVCDGGQCVQGECQPNCSGKECGPGGCGGSCGWCSGTESCENGKCVADCECNSGPCCDGCYHEPDGAHCLPDGATGAFECVDGTCGGCGLEQQSCCDWDSDFPCNFMTLECIGGVCAHCGSLGEPCCDLAGSPNHCWDDGLECQNGACVVGQAAWMDPGTGLVWQDPPSAGNYDWDDAIAYCQNLDWAGKSDWRLPDIDELRSLIKGCSLTVTGGACNVSTECSSLNCMNSACDGCKNYFGPGKQGCYWPEELNGACGQHLPSSSVATSEDNDSIWLVWFLEGDIYDTGKHLTHHVRCVR